MEEELEIENVITPSGPQHAVLNIGERRMRARYWREIGDKWVQTGLLPADPMSVNLYFSRGFKAKPPKSNGDKEEGSVSCPFCEFKPKNALSLRTHLSIHINKKKEENI